MPKATAICNSILNLMYRAIPWASVADNAAASPLSSVYLALHTAGLTASTGLQNQSEIAYTGYARKVTSRSAVDWTAAAGGTVSNATLQQFAQCGATGGTATDVSTGVGATGATAAWHFGALNSPLAIANGITPQFNIGALVVQES